MTIGILEQFLIQIMQDSPLCIVTQSNITQPSTENIWHTTFAFLMASIWDTNLQIGIWDTKEGIWYTKKGIWDTKEGIWDTK
jgi:hypothetical protein